MYEKMCSSMLMDAVFYLVFLFSVVKTFIQSLTRQASFVSLAQVNIPIFSLS